MFLVLVVHADFNSLGDPTPEQMTAAPLSTSTRLFFEALSIGCVDMFVLISGWFGIRPKTKSFLNFVFQCLFFFIGIYLFCLATGISSLTLKGIAGCFAMLKNNWFVKAYIGLYILAPVLNAFIEQATEKQHRMTLIYFYIFQTLYSWVNDAASFFMNGYSTMSFIGLYLLAQYVRRYPLRITSLSARQDFLVFGGIVLLQTLMAGCALILGIKSIGKVYNYVGPQVIVEALYLLLGFSKLNFSSRVVNWVAASSFAVYLFHTKPALWPYFRSMVKNIFEGTNGPLCLLYIFLFLVLVFVAAILIDQVRIAAWRRLWRCYEKRHSSGGGIK